MKAVDQVGFDIKCPIPMEITDFYQNNVILFNSRLYGATEFLQYKNEFTVNGRFTCPHSRFSYPSTVQGKSLDNSDKSDFTLLRQAFLDREELRTNTERTTSVSRPSDLPIVSPNPSRRDNNNFSLQGSSSSPSAPLMPELDEDEDDYDLLGDPFAPLNGPTPRIRVAPLAACAPTAVSTAATAPPLSSPRLYQQLRQRL